MIQKKIKYLNLECKKNLDQKKELNRDEQERKANNKSFPKDIEKAFVVKLYQKNNLIKNVSDEILLKIYI